MDRELFIERWQAMRTRTRAMIESIPDDARERRPEGRVRSASEIAAHVIACQATVLTGLATGEFPWSDDNERYAGMSIEAMVESARDMDALLVQMVQTADDDWFAGVPARYTLTRQAWLWETLDHEIHHVGQLATVIRMTGGEPARIFG